MNNTFVRPTDQTYQIVVTSEIASVIWGSQAAAVGEIVAITINTRFMGKGSLVNLCIQQGNGKQVLSRDLPVYGDQVHTEFTVPAEVKSDLICIVTLSPNGSQKDSLPLRLFRERAIDQLRWQPSDVCRETIGNLQARVTGIAAGDTVLIKIYAYSAQGMHLPLTQLYSQIKHDKIDLDWCFDYPQSTQDIATQIQQQDINDNYRMPQFFWTVEHDGQHYGECPMGESDSDPASGLLRFNSDTLSIDFQQQPLIKSGDLAVTWADGVKTQETIADDGHLRLQGPPGPVRIQVDNLQVAWPEGVDPRPNDPSANTLGDASRLPSKIKGYDSNSPSYQLIDASPPWRSTYAPAPVNIYQNVIAAIAKSLSNKTATQQWQENGYRYNYYAAATSLATSIQTAASP